ncbi:MAG TPA: MarC family protein [Terriglobales bacterium]|nr:MarC family protein [Terriglobales bacterium]
MPIQHLLLRSLPEAAIGTFLALFPIVNPFGAVPIFFALTSPYENAERRKTEIKVAISVITILVFFLLVGRFVLNFFGISLPVLRIAGGLIVANTAWGMVTSKSRITPAEGDEAATKEDISFTPMAMPILAGPGSIGVVMGLAANSTNFMAYIGMIVGIAVLGLVVYLFLRLGGPLVQWLGPNAVGSINRIFGFLILAVAVQLVWDGLAEFRF